MVFEWVREEHIVKNGYPLKVHEWTLEFAKDRPRQTNGSDCGVFVVKTAEYLARGSKLSFSQEDIPPFRKQMAAEITAKSLL